MMCLCGCGLPTKPYARNDRRIGAIRGQPTKWLKGHNPSAKPFPFRSIKRCPKCAKFKLNTKEFFYQDKSRSDGLSSRCKLCKDVDNKSWLGMKQYQKKYRQAHPEKRALSAKWRRNNRWKSLDSSRRWRLENRKRSYEQVRNWKKNNPEKARMLFLRAKHKRRVLEMGLQNNRIDYDALYQKYAGKCGICGEPVEKLKVAWDHITALTKGGSHSEDNLQPVHGGCNSMKGDRSLEWAKNRTVKIRSADR